MRLAVLTKIPSPYQVELFDAISARHPVELTVVYLRAADSDRSWAPRPLAHRALFLDRELPAAEAALDGAELAVFGWYRDRVPLRLLKARAARRRPWCFWGERPGSRHRGPLGTAYRRVALWPLWRDRRVPIWGIGQWAVEGYAKEFGADRPLLDVPYASDLAPYLRIPRPPGARARTILFSGSLIPRKGIEELAGAFASLARRRKDARLLVLGSGPLEAPLRERFAGDDAVELLGFRDWDGLADAYGRADILCAPSRYDGWGLVVPEGMAAGMPVVSTTSTGAARELVEVGRTGWLVPARDAAALERALEAALDLDPGSLHEMRALCRERARKCDVSAGSTRFIDAAEKTLAIWDSRAA